MGKGVKRGQQGGDGRFCPGGLRLTVFEDEGRGTELFEERCGVAAVSVEARVIGAECIDGVDQDIGPRLVGGRGDGRAGEKRVGPERDVAWTVRIGAELQGDVLATPVGKIEIGILPLIDVV